MSKQHIYERLIKEYKNSYGVAGLMGNIQAESNFKSTNLQQTYEKKLGYTDASYTKAVDDGVYHNFVRDSAGYGLAQWTYWSRKQALLNFCRSRKVSIGDLDAQIDFMIKEIKGYKAVDKAIRTCQNIREVSDIVLKQYERPANQGTSVQVKRAAYGTAVFEEFNKAEVKDYLASEVVNLAKSWIGKKESDGTHKEIIDVYNKQSPLPRGYKVTYTDAWCATFVTALFVKLGYTDIFPCECSCQKMLELAKKMGIWNETDSYIPKPGDLILYDWDDKGNGDNEGYADHVGLVEVSTDKTFKVIEGNYSNSVKRRNMAVDGLKIRGFICPAYSEEAVDIDKLARDVIAGKYGNGQERKDKLGKLYSKVQKRVNEMLR